MLVSLYVENIAIIRKLSVDFESGFTILTGETGAGKSILIDSIGLILGGKARREMIGTFSEYAFVKAGFSELSQTVRGLLAAENIQVEDGMIFIERKMNKDGRSSAKINGVQMPVSFLQTLAPYLINIHGQHDNILMLNPDKHIEFLDRFAGLEQDIADYQKEYSRLRGLRTCLQNVQQQAASRTKRLAELSLRLQEYEELQPYEGMRQHLKEKQKILQNRETAYTLMSVLKPDEEHSVQTVLSEAISHAQKLSELDSRAKEIYNNLIVMQDLAASVLCAGEDLLSDFEQGESLQQVEDKLYALENLLRLHGPNEAALLKDWENINLEYQRLSNIEDEIEKAKSAYLSQLQTVQRLAKGLSQKRRTSAEVLSRKIVDELSFLDMNTVQFKISIEQNTNAKGGYVYSSRGYDQVEFLLSANKGQQPKPLNKIASGGELSRIMLSLTNVFCNQQEVATLIFDEVDTGVSGKTAEKIGVKLKEVSKQKQVLCITHLAQIAALGTCHYKIIKIEQDGTVQTTLEKLDFSKRVEEIARIIGGIHITDTVRKTAGEMLAHTKG